MVKKEAKLTLTSSLPEPVFTISYKKDVSFTIGDSVVLKICNNGDFYVNGGKVIQDIEVYNSLKEWIELVLPIVRESYDKKTV